MSQDDKIIISSQTPPPPAIAPNVPVAVMGDGKPTCPVSLRDLFVTNRQKAIDRIVQSYREKRSLQNSLNQSTNIVVYIEGGTTEYRYDSDHEPIFRQESYFFYLTGIKEPDCAISIHLHIRGGAQDSYTSTTRLYIPNLPSEYATVMGPIRSKQEWKEMYMVDSVEYMTVPEDVTHYQNFLRSDLLFTPPHVDRTNSRKIFMLMNGVNSDSGNEYPPPTMGNDFRSLDELTIDTETLYPLLAECRVIKSDVELYLLQYVTEVTSFGHSYVMRNFQTGPKNANHPSDPMYEYQGESLFRHYCYYNYGCRLVGYTPICGCGPNSAILHYGHAGRPNADPVTAENTICLFDMGIEYYQYGSDVTCSFPSNGEFTPKQRSIYEGVLNAQITVYQMMRPGVSWVDCHKAAEGTILQALVDIGIVLLSPSLSLSSSFNHVPSKTIEELVEMRLGAVFMPHGLGHFIGLDTHDVGGYLEGHPPRIQQPGLCKLRTARVLEANMVMTVEPGCYFIQHLLDEVMMEDHVLRPYINKDLINAEYRNFGGIRLEDVVQVTAEDGVVNYTLCPRTVTEVEQVCQRQMKWPPLVDTAPELRRVRLLDTTPLPAPPSL